MQEVMLKTDPVIQPSMTTCILSLGWRSQRDGVILNTVSLLLNFNFCTHTECCGYYTEFYDIHCVSKKLSQCF